jgi:hypothetical protein
MDIVKPVFSRVFNSTIPDVDWNPLSLFTQSEPGIWYDPADITTLFQDSTGLIPVTTAGQSVGKIVDKSGRGNHATQAIALRRPTYQIDSSGKPYLLFDGVDDNMVTSIVTPATDKVQAFAGVRKLSDAAVGTIVELSTNISSNNGAFVLFASFNGGSATPSYLLQSKGTVRSSSATPLSYPAPITNVLASFGDIAGDTATVRVDGVPVITSATDQGTGNYLAYPIYIGARGGSSLFFNGRLYSLIVRFGANLATNQITSAENWVNGKTGAY